MRSGLLPWLALVALGACTGGDDAPPTDEVPGETDAVDSDRTETDASETDDTVPETDVSETDPTDTDDTVETDVGETDVVDTDTVPVDTDVVDTDTVPADTDLPPDTDTVPVDTDLPPDTDTVPVDTDLPPDTDTVPVDTDTDETGAPEPACGDGWLDPGEDCDDGNGDNLDGCDEDCRYESFVRMTSIAISGSQGFAACTPATNLFGRSVLASTSRDAINMGLADAIDKGSANALVQILGLDDPTGVNDPDGVRLALLGAWADPARGAWPGAAPLDWWFLVEPALVDGRGRPWTTRPATLTNRTVVAPWPEMRVPVGLGGAEGALILRDAHVRATVNASPAPDRPAPPPSLLRPGYVHFREVTANVASGGGLCGNLTVEALAQIPVPDDLSSSGGTTRCRACSGSRVYTACGPGESPTTHACSSLLDVVVGGCKIDPLGLGSCVLMPTAIHATPTPDAPGTGTATLSLGTDNKVPTAQWQGNTRGYSLFMTWEGKRAHVTGVAGP